MQTTVDLDYFPLGIDENYLIRTQSRGLFRAWGRGATDVTPTFNPTVQHEFRYNDGSGSVVAVNISESEDYTEFTSVVNTAAIKDQSLELSFWPSTDPASAYVSSMELLIDLPVNVGCFEKTDPDTFYLPTFTHVASPMPSTCIAACLTESSTKRYAALVGGDSCYCYTELPRHELRPLPDDQCRKACTGDEDQFCGGESAHLLQFYVAMCELGFNRFGDNCYMAPSFSDTIMANADFCHREVKENCHQLLFYGNTTQSLFLFKVARFLRGGGGVQKLKLNKS